MRSDRLRRVAREVLVLSVLVTGILAGRSVLADHYYVPSGSMEQTLHVGDRVFVDKRAYGVRLPFTSIKLTAGRGVKRGDVVIFDSPLDGKRLIKRIVAIGGDTVAVHSGRLQVNGHWLDDLETPGTERFGNRVVQLNMKSGGGSDVRLVVPPGSVLAIGDHRGNSVDGRRFGPVPESAVYGRAIAVYFRRGDGFGWQTL